MDRIVKGDYGSIHPPKESAIFSEHNASLFEECPVDGVLPKGIKFKKGDLISQQLTRVISQERVKTHKTKKFEEKQYSQFFKINVFIYKVYKKSLLTHCVAITNGRINNIKFNKGDLLIYSSLTNKLDYVIPKEQIYLVI